MRTKIYLVAVAISLGFLNSAAFASVMNKEEFGEYAFTFLNDTYKDKKFERSNKSLLILADETQLGLLNLYNSYTKHEYPGTDLNKHLKQHFDKVFTQIELGIHSERISWADAKKVLKPMIAPIEYAKKFKVVFNPIDENVVATYVLDNENGYKYVDEENLVHWGVSKDSVQEIAEANLAKYSRNLPMQGNLADVKFLMLSTHDGYDTARLLVPEFRDSIASKLGYPFHVGIPYRDFLIMWSPNNPDKMTAGFVSSIKSDFEEKPYPLTPNVLKVTKNGISVVK